ncbi:ABC transporter ATP-binding protein [Flavobacterium sp.]|uniref:ATP-binding cassette domain-containing protein n=1 Tax=Flavobacterium sp. TaxID=239 RepID=UPI0026370B17|nr:ABC transporter ATP-binding protein [Flavobacterium sp.]
MKLRSGFKEIVSIVPKQSRKSLRKFLYASILFSFLDLLSVAYLIPAMLLLLDRQKLAGMLQQYHIGVNIFNTATIVSGVVILVLIYVVKNIFQAKFNTALYQFLYRMSQELSVAAMRRHLQHNYIHYQQQDKGYLLQRVTTACRDFSTSLIASALLLASEILTFIVILSAMLACYFKLTIFTIFVTGIFALIIYQIKKKEIILINTKYKDAAAKANSELINIMDGYMEIKISGQSEKFLNRFSEEQEPLSDASAKLTATSANYSKYLEIFLIAGTAGLILYNLTMPEGKDAYVLISVLAALSVKIIPSINKILNAITMVNSHYYTVEILRQNSVSEPPPTMYTLFNKSLDFINIHFSYSEQMPVFSNLDFRIRKGEILGINGVTGSGKTTFLHLVAGLIRPNKGAIHLDNQIIRDDYFFSFVGYVPQQPFIFHGTILENITLRQEPDTVDFGYIEFLLKSLHLEILLERPKGLDTILLHNTMKLSGGQKQRLALVRALYHKPQLLILDEATNQQNDPMEKSIYQFIRQVVLSEQMAVLTVTHNPNNADFCDAVFRMEKETLIRC